jgi:hypothetical protein
MVQNPKVEGKSSRWNKIVIEYNIYKLYLSIFFKMGTNKGYAIFHIQISNVVSYNGVIATITLL